MQRTGLSYTVTLSSTRFRPGSATTLMQGHLQKKSPGSTPFLLKPYILHLSPSLTNS